jgi:hypothetical protein
MTGGAAALVSFEESSSLLHELAGVKVSISQVQRAAETLGEAIAADERVCVDRMGETAPAMDLGMDGTGVPMRPAEVADRVGKQPLNRSLVPPARKPNHGPRRAVRNWTMESRRPSSTRSGPPASWRPDAK